MGGIWLFNLWLIAVQHEAAPASLSGAAVLLALREGVAA